MSAEPRTPTTSGAQNTGAATITRILRLLEEKCPRCEEGDVFEKRGKILTLTMPVMHEECPRCRHHFEKEPGFFVGAMYVSYALTIAEGVSLYLLAHYFTSSPALLMSIIVTVVILMSLINFRYSRMIWMYIFTQKEHLSD